MQHRLLIESWRKYINEIGIKASTSTLEINFDGLMGQNLIKKLPEELKSGYANGFPKIGLSSFGDGATSTVAVYKSDKNKIFFNQDYWDSIMKRLNRTYDNLFSYYPDLDKYVGDKDSVKQIFRDWASYLLVDVLIHELTHARQGLNIPDNRFDDDQFYMQTDNQRDIEAIEAQKKHRNFINKKLKRSLLKLREIHFIKYIEDTGNDPMQDYLHDAILGPFASGKTKTHRPHKKRATSGVGGMRSGQYADQEDYMFFHKLAKAWKDVLRKRSRPTDEEFKYWLKLIAGEIKDKNGDKIPAREWHRGRKSLDPDYARRLLRQKGLRSLRK